MKRILCLVLLLCLTAALLLSLGLAAYAIGEGAAGKIARKLSHNKLCSGGRLHYSGHDTVDDEERSDRELLTDEEYQILAESGSDVWTSEV